MSAPETARPWTSLPASLRTAGIVALATMVLAGGLLYQENVRSEIPPEFSRGGAFAGDLLGPNIDEDLTVSTPEPLPTARSRSEATLRAPKGEDVAPFLGGAPPFPAIGKYIYDIEGTESATVFGSRRYPDEMTMTVHRADEALKEDELAFDLYFSDEHEEREIVAYRDDGIKFTFEGGSVTFGPTTQTSEATYDPPMTQIPIPLSDDAKAKGTSRATTSDGEEVRVEDWTVEVEGRKVLTVRGTKVNTYVVVIERKTRPGSSESLTRMRRYWLDPSRSMWVKFEEHMTGTRDVGFGDFTYKTDFTATLDRLEPV